MGINYTKKGHEAKGKILTPADYRPRDHGKIADDVHKRSNMDTHEEGKGPNYTEPKERPKMSPMEKRLYAKELVRG